MKPVCFMIMPFRSKPVTGAGEGAPKELNCDRLWDVVLRPVLDELGYLPVRADLESSSVIVKDMLNRLKHADLVLADVSLPNGNVYYELGIRHVAQENRCVQVAADWFRPLFDIEQFRTITYPLKNGEVPDSEAAGIRRLLVQKIREYRDARTPYHELVDESAELAFKDEARRLGAFQAELSEVRLMSPGHERVERTGQLMHKHAEAAGILPGIALELLFLVRDTKNWAAVREFVQSLPESTRDAEPIQEQYLLACSELGEHERAIAGIEAMIRRFGATPERCGIVGGRYKRLFRDEHKRREDAGGEEAGPRERQHLAKAIESYERGMLLDLNEYYCSCNLPALLRARGKRGDEERATAIDVQVIAACRRAKRTGSSDVWLDNTLFGTAFRGGEMSVLEDIADEIEGGVPWQLGVTLDDADDWIRQAPGDKQDALRGVLDRLRRGLDQES